MALNRKLQPIDYKEGDTAIAALAIIVELDVNKDGEYLEFCMNEFSEDLGYQTESFYDFCSGGVSSTSNIGMDPEWSGSFVLRYGTSVMELHKKRWDIGATNNIPMRVINTMANEILEINVVMSAYSTTMVANEALQVEASFKPFTGAPVITQIVPDDSLAEIVTKDVTINSGAEYSYKDSIVSVTDIDGTVIEAADYDKRIVRSIDTLTASKVGELTNNLALLRKDSEILEVTKAEAKITVQEPAPTP